MKRTGRSILRRGVSTVEPKTFDMKNKQKNNIYRNRYAHTSRFHEVLRLPTFGVQPLGAYLWRSTFGDQPLGANLWGPDFLGQPFVGQPFVSLPFVGQPFMGQPFVGQPLGANLWGPTCFPGIASYYNPSAS
jgi:hypothetical protein